MNKVYRFITTAIVSGILFLIPIGIVFIIFEKIYKGVQHLLVKLNLKLNETTFIHALANKVVIILSVLLICFLAGLFAKLRFGKQLIALLEQKVLYHMPGYEYIKANAASLLGTAESNESFREVVLYKHHDGLKLAFKVEAVNNDKMIIFVPDVPRSGSGTMLIVDTDKVIPTELSTREAFALMRRMGSGAAKILSKYVNKGDTTALAG